MREIGFENALGVVQSVRIVDESVEDAADQSSSPAPYTVVARRYRPKSFDQLIGQEHVAQALGKAIETGRVGHAYLFTGARGVGKTSTARIFAKALNLVGEVSDDLAAEITAAIDSGDDMDVIEIDGASNRGINEIRQLRANVNVRPSRARFKIYIIDEVHMLTKEAFNALLKTLEEPPPHVKFIFCTTDPDKIPITVLSRCQRFDFAPVKFDAIVKRLSEISTAEGFECEPEALALLARRAAGSMRDSQSLLEQVMSFSVGKVTAAQVHTLLGIADESLLLELVQALHQHDALTAIAAIDAARSGGSDAGQLSEQLLNYMRDIMAVGIGGSPQLLRHANPQNHERLHQIAQAWGLQTILSAIQILDEALVRMRASVSASTLLEVAIVQICQLENLASISALIAELGSGSVQAQKKKPSEPLIGDVGKSSAMNAANPTDATATNRPPTHLVSNSQRSVSKPATAAAASFTNAAVQTSSRGAATEARASAAEELPTHIRRADTGSQAQPTTDSTGNAIRSAPSNDVMSIWRVATRAVEGILADYCSMAESVSVSQAGVWQVTLPPGAIQPRDYCESPARKSQLVAALAGHLGHSVQIQFDVKPGEAPAPVAAPTNSTAERSKRMRELQNHPLIKKIAEVLDAEIVKVIPAAPKPNVNVNPKSDG